MPKYLFVCFLIDFALLDVVVVVFYFFYFYFFYYSHLKCYNCECGSNVRHCFVMFKIKMDKDHFSLRPLEGSSFSCVH